MVDGSVSGAGTCYAPMVSSLWCEVELTLDSASAATLYWIVWWIVPLPD